MFLKILLKLLFHAGFIYALLLLISHIFVLAGLIAAFRREKRIKSRKNFDKTISVIIPARNESENLPSLFKSLEKQTVDNFEIILVDDRSGDSTFEVMNSFKEKYPERVKVIQNDKTFKGRNPKQMVLDIGSGIAAGEILLFTDADCKAGAEWVEYMSSPFSDKKVGLVFGAVKTSKGKGLLCNFQIFDHLLRYFYTAASAGLKNPAGGFGNNLSLRREALNDIGGFSNIEFSVTEDAQLIAKVRDTGKWVIEAQTSKEAIVITRPAETWKDLFRQELRWSTGAIHAPDSKARFGYSFVMYQLVTGIAAVLPALFNPVLLLFFLSGIISMLMVSAVAGIHMRMKKGYWLYLIPSLILAEFLFPLVVLWATFKPVITWKGEKVSG